MATKIIPTFVDSDDYQFTVNLDGVKYLLRFTYNARDDRWYMNLSDSAGNLIIGSIPMCVNWPLLRQYAYMTNIPPGVLYCMDQSGQGVEPGRFDLGVRCLLVYEEASSA